MLIIVLNLGKFGDGSMCEKIKWFLKAPIVFGKDGSCHVLGEPYLLIKNPSEQLNIFIRELLTGISEITLKKVVEENAEIRKFFLVLEKKRLAWKQIKIQGLNPIHHRTESYLQSKRQGKSRYQIIRFSARQSNFNMSLKNYGKESSQVVSTCLLIHSRLGRPCYLVSVATAF